MYILEICEEPAILNLILFVKSILEIICIGVPIILIIMVSIDLFKIVFDASDKTIKAATKGMLNKIVATVVIFFIPTIVNLILKNLNQMNVEQTACWSNANTGTIAYYQEIKEARELSERQEKQAKIVANNKAREKADQKRKDNIVKKSEAGEKLVEVAEKELGKNGQTYKTFFGIDGEWCAMFVFWVTAHTPVSGGNNACSNVSSSGSDKCVYTKQISVKSAVVYQYMEYMAKEKKFYHAKYYTAKYGTYKNGSKDYEPQPGDLIFFNGSNSYRGDPKNCYGELSHIGIVKEVKNGQVVTIEGNTSGTSHYTTKVDSHKYSLSDPYVAGYGHWAD